MNTLAEIEADIYNSGAVNRNHLIDFLRLQTTSDQLTIEQAVKDWLIKLHDDPHYSKVIFAQGEIDKILSDLHAYGHVVADTIHEGKDPDFVPLLNAQPTASTVPNAEDIVLGTPQVGNLNTFTPAGETSTPTQFPGTDPLAAGPVVNQPTDNVQAADLWSPLT